MSVLTEEQLKEILLIIKNEVNVEWPDTMLKMLCEWNEKQLSAQFKPDWSKAPKYTVGATLNIGRETENGNWAFGYQVEKYSRPAPVITPHPHAEMMAKYAEVAARRVDPWVEFEFRNLNSRYGWDVLSGSPSFESFYEYRYIGDGK